MNLQTEEQMKFIHQSKRRLLFVTSFGRILSSTGREIRPSWNKKRGYYWVRTKDWNRPLHRIVASAFILNSLNKPQVNHKDGNKRNNHVENLEWVTASENVRHAIKSGTIKLQEKNTGSNLKYSNQQILQVYTRVKSGMTYRKAGEICSMPYSTVAHLMRGSRRRL